MSTALLKFHQLGDVSGVDSVVITAAADVCPEALGIAQDGKLIYRNKSFTDLCGENDGAVPERNVGLQRTDFSVSGRHFSLFTRLRPPTSEWQHLALIGRLVGGVAHDFNNLLTGILLYCDLMQGKLTPSNPLAEKIQEIRLAAEQGAGLIRQLMSVGREEKDAPNWVVFSDVLREMVPLLRHLVGENVHIKMELSDDSVVVGISLAQAQQIVLNLVLNARDAMPGGGEVVIRTSSRNCERTGPGDHILELTVEDDGRGMDPQTAARIFEPFFTTKATGRGTGMGLATVRKIVEDAGGTVSVETTPGKGTLMTVRLPEVTLRETQIAVPPTEIKTTSNSERGTLR